jgi:hypothetical protein
VSAQWQSQDQQTLLPGQWHLNDATR